ncbi:polysaccharide biosynthesis family protein [Novosphingobium sp. PC22D]|uniref:lipopolysaccharide biosynthesis protein n=1 Tax=Novosphingobium sp. PC22D TaxID=1962403 RepID=UPI000BF14D46|nr:oligosaccharide flippase family protein [Novosphingobium sp. PC22D]PEQ12310.1 polysaccharide biosynthesis family protein [Novosphingobium sp. PC22D]
MAAASENHDNNTSAIRRILQNTAWLLGGKGFGALCSIVYLAILTRTLGLKDFGHFSLIFGTAQTLIALAGFQTWRVVVRYGSEHVHAKDWDRFGRLGMLCGLLDAAGAVMGCGLAAILIYGFSSTFELNPRYIDIAFYFACASLWALVSAPTGIVRALHRFDSAVYVEAIVPAGRLLAALWIWFSGPTVGRFLFAWAAIDLLEAVLYWAMARRLCPQAIRLRNLRDWRMALRENEGIGRFFLVTYASESLDATMRNGPLLAVGAFISTRAAGLYRLAAQVTQALGKLSTLLTRAVYAEVARARVASRSDEFRKLALQTSLLSGATGVVVIAIALLIGEQLLGLIGGEAFEGGASILVPLAIAASFELASVAFEPVLHATGRAHLSLFARLAAVCALAFGLYLFVPLGPSGVAWGVALGAATAYVVMGALAWITLRGLDRGTFTTIGDEAGSTPA